MQKIRSFSILLSVCLFVSAFCLPTSAYTVAETLGATVAWDGATSTATIMK